MKILEKLNRKIRKYLDLLSTLIYRFRFKKFGRNSIIQFGCIINYPEKIEIGENVFIANNVWLNAYNLRDDNRASLIIKNGVKIGRYCHINAFKDVILEEDVLIADNVYLGDSDHKNSVKDVPISKQGFEYKGPVLLKKGCFVCKNAIISADTVVGEFSIVGPNAVLTESLPDKKIAIGNPAKIFDKKDK
jgi:acetyltransferase-like isoleucine patch superfamily enzyme